MLAELQMKLTIWQSSTEYEFLPWMKPQLLA
jgi:hypothetical protein